MKHWIILFVLALLLAVPTMPSAAKHTSLITTQPASRILPSLHNQTIQQANQTQPSLLAGMVNVTGTLSTTLGAGPVAVLFEPPSHPELAVLVWSSGHYSTILVQGRTYAVSILHGFDVTFPDGTIHSQFQYCPAIPQFFIPLVDPTFQNFNC